MLEQFLAISVALLVTLIVGAEAVCKGFTSHG